MSNRCYCPECDRDVPANLDGTPRRHDRLSRRPFVTGYLYVPCPGGRYNLGPLLMSPPMSLALWEGRKTVTRRGEERWLSLQVGDRRYITEEHWRWGCWMDARWVGRDRDGKAFWPIGHDTTFDRPASTVPRDGSVGWVYRPGRFMPHSLSRILVEITEKPRREPVREITDEEAIREGIEPNWVADLTGWDPDAHGYLTWEGMATAARGEDCDEDGTSNGAPAYTSSPIEAFRSCWEHLHPGTWETSCPVRIAFRRVGAPDAH